MATAFADTQLLFYGQLANAIVIQAAREYREVLCKLKEAKEGDRDYKRLLRRKTELLQFFYSEWYQMLAEIAPEVILRRIEKEVN